MGEVYRAHDTRLGRDVALKVLHSDVTQNPERRARFEREARAVAALNHPNIVAIFDIGEENGVSYFVSELVEGELLRDRIARGALPVRELLEIAVQIADGMAAAHTAGITHRDLKPENVMLTRDGRVKILDFGLARHASGPSPVQDRTVTINATQPGTVLGTANYMSPEQVRGQAVDYRSDQFSFGVILYEMITGRQAFERESAILTMSAVVTDDPPAIDQAIHSKLPPPLRWSMERCLAKEPARRYESTRDLYEDLRKQREHLSEAYSSASLPVLPAEKGPEPTPAPGAGILWKLASAALLLVSLGLAFLLFRGHKAADNLANYRFTPFAVSSEGQGSASWSWDGKAAAYLGEVDGNYQIFVRYLNAPAPVQLTTSAGIRGLYGWSPDSRRIFFRGDDPNHAGQQALLSIAAVGGDPEPLMTLDPVIAGDVSPDGKAFAVYKQDKDGLRRVYISSPIGSEFKPYPSEKFANKSHMNTPRIHFAPDGKKLLLLFRDVTEKRWLLPYPSAVGEPHEVLSSLPQYAFTPAFSWFPDSRHIVVAMPAYVGAPFNLWIADTAGPELRRVTSTPLAYQYLPKVSPDGKRVLYQEISSEMDIAKVNLSDGKTMRLIATQRDETMPAWAGRAGKFAYVSTRNGPSEVWIRNEDGSERPLVTPDDFAPTQVNFFMNPTLSPEGDRVIYTMSEVGGKALLYISAAGGGTPIRATNANTAAEFAGSLSPDGRQMAYIELDGGTARLCLVKTSGEDRPVRLRDSNGNGLPQWSPTGEWITFQDNDGWHLISPDGKKLHDLGKIKADHLAFSRDGKKLYGIRGEKEHQYLFSLETSGDVNSVKNIADLGKDYAPSSEYSPGYRLSVAPDGTCAIYSIGNTKSSIWLFQGFAGP